MGDFSLLFVSLRFPIFYNKYFPFPLYLACVIYIVKIIHTCLKYFRLKLAELGHWLEGGVWGIIFWPGCSGGWWGHQLRPGQGNRVLFKNSVASLLSRSPKASLTSFWPLCILLSSLCLGPQAPETPWPFTSLPAQQTCSKAHQSFMTAAAFT